MKHSVQKCPLCHNEATCKIVDHGKAKMFVCPQCNIFVVGNGIEEQLPELDRGLIIKLSLYSSQCPDDQIFHIHFDDLSNIVAKYVPEVTAS